MLVNPKPWVILKFSTLLIIIQKLFGITSPRDPCAVDHGVSLGG